jgi:hypothetical protein
MSKRGGSDVRTVTVDVDSDRIDIDKRLDRYKSLPYVKEHTPEYNIQDLVDQPEILINVVTTNTDRFSELNQKDLQTVREIIKQAIKKNREKMNVLDSERRSISDYSARVPIIVSIAKLKQTDHNLEKCQQTVCSRIEKPMFCNLTGEPMKLSRS